MAVPSRNSRDVVVVGAGPSGSATAQHLARLGLDVAVVDRDDFGAARPGESLAPAVQPLLRDLGVWAEFLGLDPLPSWGTRSVWGGPDPVEHSHVLSPYGSGWHVDRRAFDQMLARSAEQAGARLLLGEAVLSCRWDGHRWQLDLGDGGRLTARAVVDATGRAARIGRAAGARRMTFDRLVALSATVEGTDPEGTGHLLVETAPEGWWYVAPLPGGRTGVLLMTDADISREAGLADPREWRRCLVRTTLTRRRIADVPLVELDIRPATSQRLRRSDTLPWLAVGDAALAVDPISGSGVVRALRSAQSGARALADRLASTRPDAVQRYEAERNAECTGYLRDRARHYGAERRWSSPFWTRRLPS